jgi:hypothetical protein
VPPTIKNLKILDADVFDIVARKCAVPISVYSPHDDDGDADDDLNVVASAHLVPQWNPFEMILPW